MPIYKHCHIELDKVQGKPRPRFNTNTGVAYTTPSYLHYERDIANEWKRQVGSEFAMWDGVVVVEIAVGRRLPNVIPKRVEVDVDSHKPDVDNIEKAVLDALNGVAYPDDCVVIDGRVFKRLRKRSVRDSIDILVTYLTKFEAEIYTLSQERDFENEFNKCL